MHSLQNTSRSLLRNCVYQPASPVTSLATASSPLSHERHLGLTQCATQLLGYGEQAAL